MQRRRNVGHTFTSLCLVLALVLPTLTYVEPPKWWRKGWARGRVDSVAEAELLSQLAVILMPNSEIQEMFRSFPSPDGWGGHALEPDLTVHGVLKEKDAALFVEYDGFWRHQEKQGIAMDKRKNAALLEYAPKGSYVVRISHTKRKSLKGNVLWVKVDTWSRGKADMLLRVLESALIQMSRGLKEVMRASTLKRLKGMLERESWRLSTSGRQFADSAAARMGGNSSKEVAIFLRAEGFSAADIELLNMDTWFCGQNIEECLKPRLQWLLGLGLTHRETCKAIASHPNILRCRVKQNLKPTVQWLSELGLTKRQVAKAVGSSPQILCCSIEQNLKPTVQWLLDLGLTESQVVKTLANSPRILGLSIEQNLKPTVQWLLNMGLTKTQAAKAVGSHAQILWLSIECNLKPTVLWFLNFGLTQNQIMKAVGSCPQILGLSIEQNLEPTVKWLLDLGLTKSKVARAVANFPQILGLSIEQNLKPTVQWLLDLGLTKTQVAKAVGSRAQILWLSIEENLKPKARWLLEIGLTKKQLAHAVTSSPRTLSLSLDKNIKKKFKLILSCLTREDLVRQLASSLHIFNYNYKRLEERLTTLALQNKTSRLASAMTLSDENFARRYAT